MKIGLGISTYLRLPTFEKTIQAVMKFTPTDVLVAVADDGSSPETASAKMSMMWQAGGGDAKRLRFISSKKNEGIAANKNKLVEFLLGFEDMEHVFLMEDDVRPLKEGWMEPFMQTSAINVECHLLYLPAMNYGTARNCTGPPQYRIAWKPHCAGLLMYFRAKLLRNIGGFDMSLSRYSYEHNEYSERALIAQYHDPRWFPHCIAAESDKFLEADDIDGKWHANSVYNEREEAAFTRVNWKIYEPMHIEYIKQFEFAERQGVANSPQMRKRFL